MGTCSLYGSCHSLSPAVGDAGKLALSGDEAFMACTGFPLIMGACRWSEAGAGDLARLFVRRWKPRKEDLRGCRAPLPADGALLLLYMLELLWSLWLELGGVVVVVVTDSDGGVRCRSCLLVS